jgi:hypothetical protein
MRRQNEEVELRPFEEDIVTALQAHGRSEARTSRWILGHLGEVKRDYVMGMFKRFLEFYPAIKQFTRPPDYGSFRRCVWQLKKQGKIKPVRRLPGSRRSPIARTYYSIVK